MTLLQERAFNRVRILNQELNHAFDARYPKEATSVNISIPALNAIRNKLGEQEDWLIALEEENQINQ